MWLANLSDGTNVIEGEPVPGERTPWQQLVERVVRGEVELTGLRLFFHNAYVNALPPKNCDGYFCAQEIKKKILRGSGENAEPDKHFKGIGSVVGDKVYITWVWLNPPAPEFHVHTEVRPLDSCRVHTTVREPEWTNEQEL